LNTLPVLARDGSCRLNLCLPFRLLQSLNADEGLTRPKGQVPRGPMPAVHESARYLVMSAIQLGPIREKLVQRNQAAGAAGVGGATSLLAGEADDGQFLVPLAVFVLG
ncbi:hypothetical protein PMAYCL1PPCAC_21084, partial [Pristionchus mayeri]